MATVTKAELVDGLYNELGLSRIEARELVDLFFDSIKAALTAGHPVKLSGLGNFDLKDKKARPGRNPRTMEAKMVSARRVAVFHASQKLKQRVEINKTQLLNDDSIDE